MSDEASPTGDLTGSLLISHPSLIDPNFRRTVLFLTAHDEEEGALGFVLNRPLNRDLPSFLPDKDLEDLEDLQDVPVFLGGPVATNQLIFASLEWQPHTGLVGFTSHLSLKEAQDALTVGASLRAFVGSAGWGKGQLETELEQKAWIVHRTDEESLSPDNIKDLWFRLMRSLGPQYHLLSLAPDDPGMN